MSLVQVNQLAKAFPGQDGEINRVLQSVSFKVEGPTVVGVLGPNGVGKSITMRILAGLIEPDSGAVLIDGQPPSECRIGFVPASIPVFGWRRAIDDIAIGLEASGICRKDRHEHVIEFMRRFSIDLPLRRRSCWLSSGQKQMVNLARALVGPKPPQVLILDEPWSSLSQAVREELLQCLESIRHNMDAVVFLSAHTLDSAILACDWVLPLRERPVCLDQQDLIRVNLSRPRSIATRREPEFQDLLRRIETVFHGEPAISA